MTQKILINLEKALTKLNSYLQKSQPSELEQAGIIQAFEFSYELLWKSLKEYGEQEGLTIVSPRSAFKTAFKLGLIKDENQCLAMITDRNLTCHTYNEELAKVIYQRVRSIYAPMMSDILQKLKS